jgi:CBS domain-containing protein
MTSDVYVTNPNATLLELDRELTDRRIGGAPVIEYEELVGVVSRSDVVAAMIEDQQDASRISAYYSSPYPLSMASVAQLSSDSRKLALRLGQACVGDVMSTELLTATPEEDLRAVAGRMAEHHVHRLPVVEKKVLVGIVSALDLVAVLAQHGLSTR